MRSQCDPHANPPDSSKAWEWARHHTGSVVASAVDFTAMVMVVELCRANAVLGTAVGAVCGAMASFLLGRTWVFRRSDTAPGGQMFRYAMVASASLGLNLLGEYLSVFRAGLGYLQARVGVAVLVSNFWNYPLHKYFVFGSPTRPTFTWGGFCGDGIVNAPEECDDGVNTAKYGDTKGCGPGCFKPHYCGDGHWDSLLGEQRDNGPDNGHGLCNEFCEKIVPWGGCGSRSSSGAGGGSRVTADPCFLRRPRTQCSVPGKAGALTTSVVPRRCAAFLPRPRSPAAAPGLSGAARPRRPPGPS